MTSPFPAELSLPELSSSGTGAAIGDKPHPLIAAAIETLRTGSRNAGIDPDRQVRQPDSWLLRHCYRQLAAHGSVEAALAVVELARHREPQALYRVLPVLAKRAAQQPAAQEAVLARLRIYSPLQQTNNVRHPGPKSAEWIERMLAFSLTEAYVGAEEKAFAYLEMMDQVPRIWNTVFAREELRALLAETVGLVGLHPLTTQLINASLRQHAEPGAHFLQSVALQAAAQIERGERVRSSRRLLQRVVTTFRYATLVSLLSRRYATTVFGLVNDVDAMLDQITIIANVQDARRESGLRDRDTENLLVRQVKRPWANGDIDFRLYTLKEAVEQMDPAKLSVEQRRVLGEYLSFMGAESDGWTAAAATSALLYLGQIEQAKDVVSRIPARDATRSEAFTVLIQGLLTAGLIDEAAVQTEKAITWANALPEIHPERLTIWGVAKAYLAVNMPQRALYLLERRRQPSMLTRFRRIFRSEISEEDLREEALRLHANLLEDNPNSAQSIHAMKEIRRLAPSMLEGKALALFYSEHVLEPLLETGHHELLWEFLSEVEDALSAILSREQPARVEAVAEVLVRQLALLQDAPEKRERAEKAAHNLLTNLWSASAKKGIWPAVYSVGGSLPLLSALARDGATVEIARVVAEEGLGAGDLGLGSEDWEEEDELVSFGTA